MAIQNPPITDNSTLDFTLLELIRESNDSQQRLLQLISQIQTAVDFADLQKKVNSK